MRAISCTGRRAATRKASPQGALLRDAHRLAGIPGVLIHGRLDMGGPLGTAWELAQGWPDARLLVVDEEGHLGGGATRGHVLDALDQFALTK